MPYFNSLKSILILFVSVMSMNEDQSNQNHDCPQNKKKVFEVVKSLQDILLPIDCFSFKDGGKFHLTHTIPHFCEEYYLNRYHYFSTKEIINPNIKPQDITRTEWVISMMLKTLLRKAEIAKKTATHEFYLISNMNKAIGQIRNLSKNIGYIKVQKNEKTKESKIQIIKNDCTELYDSLLNLRYTSFIDCVLPIDDTYNFFEKIDLASTIYSLAVIHLREFKSILN